MDPLNPERLDALAAQYVLGTLSLGSRQRVGELALSDAALADAIRSWESRLLPLAEALPPVTPPERVWAAILGRIQRTGGPTSIWSNLGLWRGLTLAGFATALALTIVMVAPRPDTPAATMVVVLAGQDSRPALIASVDRSGRTLTIKSVAQVQTAADRVLQLWALPAQGNPQSLGVVGPPGGPSNVVRLELASPAGQALQNIAALAVSLEPAGGSPTGLPTGPVLYSGPIQRLY